MTLTVSDNFYSFRKAFSLWKMLISLDNPHLVDRYAKITKQGKRTM